MERLQALGAFTPPTLVQLECALDRCLDFERTAVGADLWDVGLLPACEVCRVQRIDRLKRINLIGRAEPRVACFACSEASAT
jgi:hypothetical protein